MRYGLVLYMSITTLQLQTSADQQRTVSVLRQFGCNERQAEIYMQALLLGPSSVQRLARALNQNRITVHTAVNELVKKGFLYETRRGDRRVIAAEDPNVLHRL